MKLRSATVEDADDIFALAQRFAAGTDYGALVTPNRDAITRLLHWLLKDGAVFVGEVDGHLVGMLALAIITNPMSGELQGEELAWWVDPAHRKTTLGPRLLHAAELFCATQGITVLRMVAPTGSGVGDHYRKRGYIPVETSYFKRVTADGVGIRFRRRSQPGHRSGQEPPRRRAGPGG